MGDAIKWAEETKQKKPTEALLIRNNWRDWSYILFSNGIHAQCCSVLKMCSKLGQEQSNKIATAISASNFCQLNPNWK